MSKTIIHIGSCLRRRCRASWLVKTAFALLALSAIVCTIGATALVDEFYPTQLIGQGATLVIAAGLAAAGLYLMIRPCVARTYIVRIYHEDDKKNVNPYDKRFLTVLADLEPDRAFLLSYLLSGYPPLDGLDRARATAAPTAHATFHANAASRAEQNGAPAARLPPPLPMNDAPSI